MSREVHSITENLLFQSGFERTEMKVNEKARRLETYYEKGEMKVMYNGFFYSIKGQRIDFIEEIFDHYEKS